MSIGRLPHFSPITPLVNPQALAAMELQVAAAAVSALALDAPELGRAARDLLAISGMALPATVGQVGLGNPFAALSAMDPRALAALNELHGPLPANAWSSPAELRTNLDETYGAGAAGVLAHYQQVQQQAVIGVLAALAGADATQLSALLGGGRSGNQLATRLLDVAQALQSPTTTPAELADVVRMAEMGILRHAQGPQRGRDNRLGDVARGASGVGRHGFDGGHYTGQGSLGNVVARRRPEAVEVPPNAFRADTPSASGQMALEAARSQVGVREASGNNDGIPSQRYMNGRQEPWCANFVAWTFRQTGHPLPGNQRSLASVQYMEDQMKGAGKFIPRGAQQPRPGDIIFFANRGDSDRGGGRHVGIVEKVENGRVYTIEGNSGNQVARRSYPLNATRISGYGRP